MAIHDEIKAVNDHLDDLLLAGRFNEVSEYLENFPVDFAAKELLVAMLTLTWPAKEVLPARAAFMEKAERNIRGGISESRAERILARLR